MATRSFVRTCLLLLTGAGCAATLAPTPAEPTLAARTAMVRAALAQRSYESAIEQVDGAGAVGESDPVLQELGGRALLGLAEREIEHGSASAQTMVLLEDALLRLERAEPRREVLLHAARASWLLSRGAEAHELAHRARSRGSGTPEGWDLPLRPERIEYDAAWLALRQERAAGRGEEELVPLVQECLEHLAELRGIAPQDPWVWRATAVVLESSGRPEDAFAMLDIALDFVPEDAELREDLLALGIRNAGRADLLKQYERRLEAITQDPVRSALAGRLAFELALEAGASAERERLLAAARWHLERAQDIAWARDYELVAAGRAGWSALAAGEGERARAEFARMAAARPRGLEWRVEGRLPSGRAGLCTLAALELWRARRDPRAWRDWSRSAALLCAHSGPAGA